MNDFIDRARRIADDVLFPSALAVDMAGTVPESHYELLAEEGYYGIVAPPENGRPDLASNFGAQVAEARGWLDAALDEMPVARAAAAELAYRVAGAPIAALGSTSITMSHHAQRLAREAVFVLVTATRQETRTNIVGLFGRSPLAGSSGSAVFRPLTR